MPEKFDQYNDVLNRLVSEAVACTPQEWTTGTLTIETDGRRIDYRLKNESQSGVAVISEKLRDLIDELYIRMSQHGDTWVKAEVTFFQEGNSLRFKTNFAYATSAPALVPAKAKSKWKFW